MSFELDPIYLVYGFVMASVGLFVEAKDPTNPYIQNNLELLDESIRMGKAVQ